MEVETLGFLVMGTGSERRGKRKAWEKGRGLRAARATRPYLRCAPTEPRCAGLGPAGDDPLPEEKTRGLERGWAWSPGGIVAVAVPGAGSPEPCSILAAALPGRAAERRRGGGACRRNVLVPVCRRRRGHAGPGDKLQQEAPEREGRRIPPSVVDVPEAWCRARPPRLPPGGTSLFGQRSRRAVRRDPRRRACGAAAAAKERRTLRGVVSEWFESDIRQRK